MKKRVALIPILLILFLASAPGAQAQDGFFSNAQTLARGTFAIGLQPVVLTAQDDFMFITRAAYGFDTGLTGHAKVGFFDDETYIGYHFEANLASEPTSALSLALLGGVYSYGDIGLKMGMNVSRNLGPVSLYGGLNYQPLFANSQTVSAFLIPIGLDMHLDGGTLDLMIEGDIPVSNKGEYLEAIVFGTRIYVN